MKYSLKGRRISEEKGFGLTLIAFFAYLASVFMFNSSVELVKYSNMLFIAFVFISYFTLKILPTDTLKKTLVYLPFYAYCAFSIVWAADASNVVSDIRKLFLTYILFVTVVLALNNERKIEWAIRAFAFAGVCLSLYFFDTFGYAYVMNAIIDGERIGGEIVQINEMGTYASLSIVASFFLLLRKRNILYLITGIFTFPVLLGSGSRRSFLIIIAVFATALILKLFRSGSVLNFLKNFLIIVLVLVVVWLCVINIPVFDGIVSRFTELNENLTDTNSDYSRTELLRSGWKFFKEKPILGWGSGNSGLATMSVMGKSSYMHNNYIEMLVNGGICAFVLFYSVYVIMATGILKRLKQRSHLIDFGLYLIVAELVSDIAITSYTSKILYIVWGLIFAIIINAERKEKPENELEKNV